MHITEEMWNSVLDRLNALEVKLHPKEFKRSVATVLKDWTNDALQDLEDDEFVDEDEGVVEEVTEPIR